MLKASLAQLPMQLALPLAVPLALCSDRSVFSRKTWPGTSGSIPSLYAHTSQERGRSSPNVRLSTAFQKKHPTARIVRKKRRSVQRPPQGASAAPRRGRSARWHNPTNNQQPTNNHPEKCAVVRKSSPKKCAIVRKSSPKMCGSEEIIPQKMCGSEEIISKNVR